MEKPNADPGPASPSARVPHVGETIADRYRLDGEAGRTEAGVVFDARDELSRRRVTIEIATSLEAPEARLRWARDAMRAQRLEGSHVLRVIDVGNTAAGDVPFAVREPTVSTLAAEVEAHGALPLAQAVGWTLEACEAVAEAHTVGIAHGDLRLDNVYLARGTNEPTVKVAWSSAAKAERAAKEDVQRDIAGLGAMLRVLATGQNDLDDEGAQTLPTGVAHAISRALAQGSDDAFHNVSELARELAPFAPPGHGSARTIAFLLSRAGIVGSAISIARPESGATAQAGADRPSFTDSWFGHPSQSPAFADPTTGPPRKNRSATFAVVSLLLVGAVLAGTWLLWQTGKLPRWTGTAPPEDAAVGTTQVTSGAADESARARDDREEDEAEAARAREEAAPKPAAPATTTPRREPPPRPDPPARY